MLKSKLATGLLTACYMASCLAQPRGPNEGPGVRDSNGCEVDYQQVYDATAWYWYTAKLRLCSDKASDLTQGQFAPIGSEELIIVGGRIHAMRNNMAGHAPGVMMRGERDKSYWIDGNDTYGLLGINLSKNRTDGYTWSNVARVLPFVPTKFYDLGETDHGRYIAYSGLRFLPSLRKLAPQFDENTVIVMMNGYSFASTGTIVDMLGADWPAVMQTALVEIVYFQKDEATLRFRRAFIPEFRRSAVAAEWRQATSDPGAQWLDSDSQELRDRFGNFVAYAGALLTVGAILAGLSAFSNGSSSTNGSTGALKADIDLHNSTRKADDHQTDRRKSGGASTKAIHPFYDELGWGSATPAGKH